MKIRTFSLLVIFSLLITLASCTKGNAFVVREGNFVDKETGIEYISTSWEYEPISVSDEIYGEYSELNDLLFYVMDGVDPQKYICDNMETVYYAKGLTMPSLNEMEIDYVNVYNQYDELVVHINDMEFIAKLVDAFVNGYNSYSSIYLTNEVDIKTNQRIKFADSDEGFYYVLAYVEYAEPFYYTDKNGRECQSDKVLFNRYTQTYVVVDEFINDYYATIQE